MSARKRQGGTPTEAVSSQDGSEDWAAFQAAADGCPMLKEPRINQVAGKNACVSPLHYMAETLQPRDDLPELPLSWGLYREEIASIPKKGIQVANEVFSCDELDDYVTGSAKDARREFQIRYDRALAASHRLEEILLYEKVDEETWRFRLRVPRKSVVTHRFSRARIHRERHQRLKSLIATRGKMEDGYRNLVGSERAVDRLIDAAIARQQRRVDLEKPERDEADDETESDEPSPLAEALVAAEEEAVEDEDDDTPADGRQAEEGDPDGDVEEGGDEEADEFSPLAMALKERESHNASDESDEEA